MQENKQLILLCGGPDRCGKTNILEALERKLRISKFKASGEHENFLSSQDQFLNELRYADPRIADFLFQTGVSVLMDRGYMCEFVYSQFFGRETDYSTLRKLDIQYARMNAVILICTRKSFDGIQDDLDPKLDGTALQEISNLYDTFIEWTKCRVIKLFVDDEDLEREVTEIMSQL